MSVNPPDFRLNPVMYNTVARNLFSEQDMLDSLHTAPAYSISLDIAVTDHGLGSCRISPPVVRIS